MKKEAEKAEKARESIPKQVSAALSALEYIYEDVLDVLLIRNPCVCVCVWMCVGPYVYMCVHTHATIKLLYASQNVDVFDAYSYL